MAESGWASSKHLRSDSLSARVNGVRWQRLIPSGGDRLADASNGSPPAGFLIPLGGKSWAGEPQYPVSHKNITIGRGPNCDVRINHPTVSRLHAELSWADGRLLLTHLSAVNPTLVNGTPARGSTPLQTGDLIEI